MGPLDHEVSSLTLFTHTHTHTHTAPIVYFTSLTLFPAAATAFGLAVSMNAATPFGLNTFSTSSSWFRGGKGWN